jgi:CheY-like chemotaxis protein
VERRCLNGRVVLVVEDEPLVALDIAQLLADFGACVASARGVKEALLLIETRELTAAVLDINLAGEDCSPLCQRLTERAIPFLFHTGYTDAPVLKQWSAAPVVHKPASGKRVIEALIGLLVAVAVVIFGCVCFAG